ncbi:MAG: DUF3604 domain-containing protein [Pseudomonadales bacterium]|nr:DUF3604 domain-containing protein [Pseudomonadales bacterium]MCP5185052.1 DUF3604 domain-containing protein [Pseudomonadales bacterium]
MRSSFLSLPALLLACIAANPTAAGEVQCEYRQPGVRNVYWGDLHVHTAYSLDAYGFGTVRTPEDAFRFARGEPTTLPDGTRVAIDRPLDFMATTDHAEWFDFLSLCDEPAFTAHPQCAALHANNNPANGGKVFGGFVVPSITRAEPATIDICRDNPTRCADLAQSQWLRIQEQANAANDPCRFSAIIGFEWSATPNASHTHRNVIFRNASVSRQAIDYIRYPKLGDLYGQLDRQCDPASGCAVMTIPHNTNMGDGESFDVETESDALLRGRARYERLVEIFQEKGNSECLSPLGVNDEADCTLEVRLSKHSQTAKPADFTAGEWEHMRATYVRGLLLRGLAAWARSGEARRNPLQLGIVGATDNHAATPGFVQEADWQGSVFAIGSFDRAMTRIDWNPGGITGVWAEQNTRESLFDAMQRREVYATSGTRIRLRFDAATGDDALACDRQDDSAGLRPMGSELNRVDGKPRFRVSAQFDRVPLERVEIVRGAWNETGYETTVVNAWEGEGRDVCATWTDSDFDDTHPAFWYARVQETASPRWSAAMCQRAGRCEEFPAANTRVKERAWSSPIWYLPGGDVDGR